MSGAGENAPEAPPNVADLAYWVRWYERQVDIAERNLAGQRQNLEAAKGRLREALNV